MTGITHGLGPSIRTNGGGVPTRIILAIGTLVIVGVFIIALLSRNEERQRFHYSNALTIAEYGLGEALMKLGQDPTWKNGFESTPYKDGEYSVSLSTRQSNDTLFLSVESVGRSGPAERKKIIVLRAEVTAEGDTLWRQHANF